MPDSPYRYFRVDPDAYAALTAHVDSSRGYPNDDTERGLQLFEDLLHEEDGWGLIAIDVWRFTEDDDSIIADAVDAGTVEELDVEVYRAKRDAILDPPLPEPEPEPELEPDWLETVPLP